MHMETDCHLLFVSLEISAEALSSVTKIHVICLIKINILLLLSVLVSFPLSLSPVNCRPLSFS